MDELKDQLQKMKEDPNCVAVLPVEITLSSLSRDYAKLKPVWYEEGYACLDTDIGADWRRVSHGWWRVDLLGTPAFLSDAQIEDDGALVESLHRAIANGPNMANNATAGGLLIENLNAVLLSSQPLRQAILRAAIASETRKKDVIFHG